MDDRQSRAATRLLLGAMLLGGPALGCLGPAPYVVETFQSSPRGWVVIDRNGESPAADLRVEHGRLLLGGARMLCQDFVLRESFSGLVDIAIAGGDADGIAGVFVEESTPLSRTVHCLAINTRGEWASYDGNPMVPPPLGRWRALEGRSIVDHLRVRMAKYGDGLVLSVDGAPETIAAFRVTAAASRLARSSGFRIGVFTYLLDVTVDNFIVGDDSIESVPFNPERHTWWGTRADAIGLVELATHRARAFAQHPRRMSFLGVIEPLDAARHVHIENGDAIGLQSMQETAARLLQSSRVAVDAARSEDLLNLAIATLDLGSSERDRLLGDRLSSLLDGARRARSEGRPAESLIFYLAAREVGQDEEIRASIENLSRDILRPLRLDLEVEDRSSGADRIDVDERRFARAAIDAYGSLPRSSSGELAVRLVILEAVHDHDRARATRNVLVTRLEGALTAEQAEELERLEKQFPEDLRDARKRALIMKAGSIKPDIESSMRRVSFSEVGVDEAEIHRSDLVSLRQTYDRLVALRTLAKDAEKSTVRVLVPAESITDLARFRVSYEVALEGRTLLEGTVSGVRGVEQWEHDAVPEKRVAASHHDPVRGEQVIHAARRQVLARLRTDISRDSLFGKLTPDESTALLVRIARATRSKDDRFVLQWRLRNRYGLRGLTLENVTRFLVE